MTLLDFLTGLARRPEAPDELGREEVPSRAKGQAPLVHPETAVRVHPHHVAQPLQIGGPASSDPRGQRILAAFPTKTQVLDHGPHQEAGRVGKA